MCYSSFSCQNCRNCVYSCSSAKRVVTMAQKHVVKISSIYNYFTEDKKLVERGENALESGHVMNMQFNDELKTIVGSVHASMRDKLYKVQITLNAENHISESSCTCPRGRATCHYVAALALFSHYNVSVTDKSCSWAAKKPLQTEEVHTIQDLYPLPKSFVACKTKIAQADVDELCDQLNRFGGNVGFSWLLGPKIAPTEEPLLITISEIIFSKDFIESESKVEYFKRKAEVSPEKIVEVAAATVNQVSNPLWLQQKKFRLTSSNFGSVLAACRRNKYPPSLFKKLTGAYNLDGVKAVQWGRDNEKCAVEAFSAATGLSVTKTGLWLNTCGLIGASPDGLVGEDGVLEIKCPFKFRNSDLTIALGSNDMYIIIYDKENGCFKVNKNHDYFHQIQGQLHIVNKKQCHLVVWTPGQIIIVIVEREESWKGNIDVIQNFYVNHFLNHIANMKD